MTRGIKQFPPSAITDPKDRVILIVTTRVGRGVRVQVGRLPAVRQAGVDRDPQPIDLPLLLNKGISNVREVDLKVRVMVMGDILAGDRVIPSLIARASGSGFLVEIDKRQRAPGGPQARAGSAEAYQGRRGNVGKDLH